MKNREFIFRTWDKRYNIMIGPAELIPSDTSILILSPNVFFYRNASLHFESAEHWNKYFKENLVVQQYIGLSDKNGKKVFEGDIVKFQVYNYHDEQREEYSGQVSFENGMFIFGKEGFATNDSNFITESLEVIGNIFENPELFKQ